MTRTISQNAFYWSAIVPAVAETLGLPKDAAHEHCKALFLVNRETGEVGSTTSLNVGQFREYVRRIETDILRLERIAEAQTP